MSPAHALCVQPRLVKSWGGGGGDKGEEGGGARGASTQTDMLGGREGGPDGQGGGGEGSRRTRGGGGRVPDGQGAKGGGGGFQTDKGAERGGGGFQTDKGAETEKINLLDGAQRRLDSAQQGFNPPVSCRTISTNGSIPTWLIRRFGQLRFNLFREREPIPHTPGQLVSELTCAGAV